jgi:pimeloyl-ACP methyl ester carboxylesterase
VRWLSAGLRAAGSRSDRLGEFFTDAQVNTVDGVGHFTPVECPAEFAELIGRAVTSS